jgi:hypothetical protein
MRVVVEFNTQVITAGKWFVMFGGDTCGAITETKDGMYIATRLGVDVGEFHSVSNAGLAIMARAFDDRTR